MREERLEDAELLNMLRLVAPGTLFREGLENILKARTGALIVIGDSQDVMKIVDGGFFIDKEYSPAQLYELAKMDGAIILNKDMNKILYANALLIPNPSIPTNETGTRHKTAERFARQTGEAVICISQRRNIITLYLGTRKYILKNTPAILTRANQALQTLDKYKSALDNAMSNLNILEFEDAVTLDDVAVVIQRTEMVMRVVAEIDRCICELGDEGRMISMQLEELLVNIEDDAQSVIEDYMMSINNKTADDIQKQIRLFTHDELMDLATVLRALGYYSGITSIDVNVTPRGYRMMRKISHVPPAVVRKIVDEFGSLQEILKASIDQLDDVEGIGEVRARAIKVGLKRVEEQILLDRRRIY